jgi:UDPglucose 6-dehydrogenase
LNAGIGYGGSCFPKDVQAFYVVANQCNYDFGLLTEVMRINAEQRHRFLKKVRSALWTLRGKQLGVLGLAFKSDTDDIRESPGHLRPIFASHLGAVPIGIYRFSVLISPEKDP